MASDPQVLSKSHTGPENQWPIAFRVAPVRLCAFVYVRLGLSLALTRHSLASFNRALRAGGRDSQNDTVLLGSWKVLGFRFRKS